VFFLEPRNPALPAEAQEITSPCLFVIEMMRLLKEAWMKTRPSGDTFTLRLTTFLDAPFAIFLLHCEPTISAGPWLFMKR